MNYVEVSSAVSTCVNLASVVSGEEEDSKVVGPSVLESFLSVGWGETVQAKTVPMFSLIRSYLLHLQYIENGCRIFLESQNKIIPV